MIALVAGTVSATLVFLWFTLFFGIFRLLIFVGFVALICVIVESLLTSQPKVEVKDTGDSPVTSNDFSVVNERLVRIEKILEEKNKNTEENTQESTD